MNRTILILAAALSLAACEQTNPQITTCTIDSKESVKLGGDEGSQYRVYCSDGQVFKNEDEMFTGGDHAKFDSATLQASLKVGQTYTFHTIGWRSPVWSMFPNIIEATPK